MSTDSASVWRRLRAVGLASVMALGLSPVTTSASAEEIFYPMLVTRTGPFATAASIVGSGQQDYFALLNATGGIEGHTIRWEECEFAYQVARALECYERYRGKWQVVYPNSTPVIYALADRVTADKVLAINLAGGRPDSTDGTTFPFLSPVVNNFWAQASSTIQYIADKEGGLDKLRGKKIAYVHLDNDYGRSAFPAFDALAKKYGFEWRSWPQKPPALEQSATWVDIARRYRADWTIGWLYGQSCSVAYTQIRTVAFPLDKYIGTLWCGSEEDIASAGDLAVGTVTANYHGVGPGFPVIQSIIDKVYGAGKGNTERGRVGSVGYNRGVLTGIIIAEAIRHAIKDEGLPLTGEKVRNGFRKIKLDAARLKELGAEGLLPELAFSAEDHGGIGPQLFQTWDGKNWKTISDWIKPDEDVVRDLVKSSAAQYRQQVSQTPKKD